MYCNSEGWRRLCDSESCWPYRCENRTEAKPATRSGQSIFARPKPIDLSSARRRPLNLDIDMEGEEDSDELGRPLIRSDVVFDADGEARPAHTTSMPRAAQAVQERDTEDMWAELG